MKQRKLNYRFHNPNSMEDTAHLLCKLLIVANAGKVERALQKSDLGYVDRDKYIDKMEKVDMVNEKVGIKRRAR